MPKKNNTLNTISKESIVSKCETFKYLSNNNNKYERNKQKRFNSHSWTG